MSINVINIDVYGPAVTNDHVNYSRTVGQYESLLSLTNGEQIFSNLSALAINSANRPV